MNGVKGTHDRLKVDNCMVGTNKTFLIFPKKENILQSARLRKSYKLYNECTQCIIVGLYYARKNVALGEENSKRDTRIIIDSRLSFGHPNHSNSCRDIRHPLRTVAYYGSYECKCK